jgi:hypothetical protein
MKLSFRILLSSISIGVGALFLIWIHFNNVDSLELLLCQVYSWLVIIASTILLFFIVLKTKTIVGHWFFILLTLLNISMVLIDVNKSKYFRGVDRITIINNTGHDLSNIWLINCLHDSTKIKADLSRNGKMKVEVSSGDGCITYLKCNIGLFVINIGRSDEAGHITTDTLPVTK